MCPQCPPAAVLLVFAINVCTPCPQTVVCYFQSPAVILSLREHSVICKLSILLRTKGGIFSFWRLYVFYVGAGGHSGLFRMKLPPKRERGFTLEEVVYANISQ